MIANPTAVSRQGKRGKGFQKAGRQSAKAAVAKAGVWLCLLHHIVINAQLRKDLLHLIEHFQIDQCIAKETPHQKFHGEVINHLCIPFIIFIMGFHPLIGNHIAHSKHCRLIQLLRRCIFQCFAVQRFHIFPNELLQFLFFNSFHTKPP